MVCTARFFSLYFILYVLKSVLIVHVGTRFCNIYPFTEQAIVSASALPLSIIIVGIGNADFTAMETLDADTVALAAGGVKAVRDIVQFVPFNKFIFGDPSTARIRLAKEVLAEIPTQLVGYMKANNITPKPPSSTITLLPQDPESFK